MSCTAGGRREQEGFVDTTLVAFVLARFLPEIGNSSRLLVRQSTHIFGGYPWQQNECFAEHIESFTSRSYIPLPIRSSSSAVFAAFCRTSSAPSRKDCKQTPYVLWNFSSGSICLVLPKKNGLAELDDVAALRQLKNCLGVANLASILFSIRQSPLRHQIDALFDVAYQQ